ncbi:MULTISPECIES: AMP-binding protein [unclassified Duganella]|uniref:AMP-binding protein n=1 Tax=unclassified Duganella TaxID=2636909 RepID=UPI00087E623B|nr:MULTISPECIES: AMP-binding protein [unclassified Duganella]SDF41467.1 Acyl-coenzyme A synthetase/AMP-(fatty) acid ligase [Duganella sp. OV458]SDI85155.1 Acyl-coenzyme A synthetase/AMP-(fatty) acid ligase [Duganella sp. OV510]
MSDRIEDLAAAIAARPAHGLLGWRAGVAVSNAQFLTRVRDWHALLRAQAGRNYALYLDDSIEFGAALLGAWHAGKTIWLSADTLEASCASLRAQVDGFLGQFPAALQPLQPQAANGSAGDMPARALASDLPALVVFTSGSTGTAQAIPKKMSQIASEVATLEQLFGRAVGDAAVLATVSHQHIYGLLFKVLWPLSSARAIHALSIAFHEELAPAMAAGPCVLVASPAHLKRLPEHLDWSGAARMLRGVFSSGGPLPEETAFSTGALLGEVPIEVYGSSETGGIAWRQRSRCGDDSWLPFPTVDWRINEEDATLEVRSLHLPDDGWLTLADRAERVAHSGPSRFLLLGRADRIVKIEEKRISLTAMEAALLASGLVAEARVILCEPETGERQRLAALIVPAPAGRALLEEQGKNALNTRLRSVLATTVEAVALPRRWRYLDQIPVNAQGKITLAALQALLDNEDGASNRPRFPRMRELERESARVLLEISAPANLLYFDGHFDVAPILPGVVQIDWAMHYGRQFFTLPTRFRGIHALKFQQVIQPEMPVQLELVYDTVKNSLNFRFMSAAGQHASGRVMLEDVDV